MMIGGDIMNIVMMAYMAHSMSQGQFGAGQGTGMAGTFSGASQQSGTQLSPQARLQNSYDRYDGALAGMKGNLTDEQSGQFKQMYKDVNTDYEQAKKDGKFFDPQLEFAERCKTWSGSILKQQGYDPSGATATNMPPQAQAMNKLFFSSAEVINSSHEFYTAGGQRAPVR